MRVPSPAGLLLNYKLHSYGLKQPIEDNTYPSEGLMITMFHEFLCSLNEITILAYGLDHGKLWKSVLMMMVMALIMLMIVMAMMVMMIMLGMIGWGWWYWIGQWWQWCGGDDGCDDGIGDGRDDIGDDGDSGVRDYVVDCNDGDNDEDDGQGDNDDKWLRWW